MGRLGGGEILLILLIALLIFGPSKLADMGKGLGEGLKNFKKGISHGDDSDDDAPAGGQKVVVESPKVLAQVATAASPPVAVAPVAVAPVAVAPVAVAPAAAAPVASPASPPAEAAPDPGANHPADPQGSGTPPAAG